ncbi:hypothetical protein [Natrialba aegyptia]|uniref:hypothetical protein n=1 Tax=Natrialba aegyptia TaxID=129789 RepID=UPI00403AC7D3
MVNQEANCEVRVNILESDRIAIQTRSSDSATDLEEHRLDQIVEAIEDSIGNLEPTSGGEIDGNMDREVIYDNREPPMA